MLAALWAGEAAAAAAEEEVDSKVVFCTKFIDEFNYGLVEENQFDEQGQLVGTVLTKNHGEQVDIQWAQYRQCIKYLNQDPWTKTEYMRYALSPAAAEAAGDEGARRHLLLGKHHPVVLVPGKPNFNRMSLIPAYDFVVGSFVKHTGTYDLHEESVLRLLVRPDNCVVEVGSNIGAYTVVLADQVGPGGLVYALEPFRKIFQIMNANVALQGYGNVVTRQVGIAGKSERLSVKAPNLNDFTNLGAARVFFQQDEDIAHVPFDGFEEIEVETLDNLHINCGQSKEDGAKKVDFLKIDAEGMELEVIEGGMRMISEHQPLIYVESQPFFQAGDERFILKMREKGYTCNPIPGLEMHELMLCIPLSRYDEMTRQLMLLAR